MKNFPTRSVRTVTDCPSSSLFEEVLSLSEAEKMLRGEAAMEELVLRAAKEGRIPYGHGVMEDG